MLSIGSQFFVLGETEQEYTRRAIEFMLISKDILNQDENLEILGCASVIVAVGRDAELADKIADKIVDLFQCDLQDQQIAMALMIIIRTSATFTDDATWYDWTEERLARIANCLPAGQSAQVFLDCCDSMNIVLPLDNSVHLRAKVLASAGAV